MQPQRERSLPCKANLSFTPADYRCCYLLFTLRTMQRKHANTPQLQPQPPPHSLLPASLLTQKRGCSAQPLKSRRIIASLTRRRPQDSRGSTGIKGGAAPPWQLEDSWGHSRLSLLSGVAGSCPGTGGGDAASGALRSSTREVVSARGAGDTSAGADPGRAVV